MNKIPVAVLGCTGIVGRLLVDMLSGHPFFEIGYLAASEKHAGRSFGELAGRVWRPGTGAPDLGDMILGGVSVKALTRAGTRVVFSALPAVAAGRLETELRRCGFFVFTNASAHRYDPDVPIIVPEVNAGHLELARLQARKNGGFIVAGPNCSTSGLVLGLKPLLKAGLESVTAATFQSISGAGRNGLAAWDIAANVVPLIKGEEDKMRGETRKILGRRTAKGIVDHPVRIEPTCCRVPVRVGHLLAVDAETTEDLTTAEAEDAFGSFRGLDDRAAFPTAPDEPVILRREEDRPQPVLDAAAGSPARTAGMSVSVGRIRAGNGRVRFVALVNNLVRGSAGACVLNAELARARSLMDDGVVWRRPA